MGLGLGLGIQGKLTQSKQRLRWPRYDAKERRNGRPPLPPPDLMFVVAGSYDPERFLELGRLAAESIPKAYYVRTRISGHSRTIVPLPTPSTVSD